jgi:thiol-disulfide isomerase/thioredoxin
MRSIVYTIVAALLFALSALGRFPTASLLPLIFGVAWAAFGILRLSFRWRSVSHRVKTVMVIGCLLATSSPFAQALHTRAKHERWHDEALAAFGRTGAPELVYARVVNDRGGEWRDTEYTGITVLNFWATWCPPCLKEMPLLEAFSKRHDPGLVRVVGFTRFYEAKDEAGRSVELGQIEQVLRRSGVTYPSLIAMDKTTHDAFHVHAIPTTVLIAPDGRVHGWGIGEPGAREVLRLAEELAARRRSSTLGSMRELSAQAPAHRIENRQPRGVGPTFALIVVLCATVR